MGTVILSVRFSVKTLYRTAISNCNLFSVYTHMLHHTTILSVFQLIFPFFKMFQIAFMFISKVYYSLALFYCILYCLARAAFFVLNVTDNQIGTVYHFPIANLDGSFRGFYGCRVGNLYIGIMNRERICWTPLKKSTGLRSTGCGRKCVTTTCTRRT